MNRELDDCNTETQRSGLAIYYCRLATLSYDHASAAPRLVRARREEDRKNTCTKIVWSNCLKASGGGAHYRYEID